jgi:hypothetical protein
MALCVWFDGMDLKEDVFVLETIVIAKNTAGA